MYYRRMFMSDMTIVIAFWLLFAVTILISGSLFKRASASSSSRARLRKELEDKLEVKRFWGRPLWKSPSEL